MVAAISHVIWLSLKESAYTPEWMNTKLIAALAVFCFIAITVVPAVQADANNDVGYQYQLDANGQKVYKEVSDRFVSEINGGDPQEKLQFLISLSDPMLFTDEEQAEAYATDVVNSALAAIYYTDAEAVWLWDLPITVVEIKVTCSQAQITSSNTSKPTVYVMPVSVMFSVSVPEDMADDPSTTENETYGFITALREARIEVEGSVSEKVKAIADRLHSVRIVDNPTEDTSGEGAGDGNDSGTGDGETPSEGGTEVADGPRVTSVGNAYDALVTGVSSTDGIAAAFTYLCRYNGVDAYTVRGTIVSGGAGETGCWNVVRNDDEAGTWYATDISMYDGDDRSPLMAGASTAVNASGDGFSAVHIADLDLESGNSLSPIQISIVGYDWPDDRTFLEKYGTHVFATIMVAIIAAVLVYAIRTGNV